MKTEHIELLDRLEACVLDDSDAAFPFSRRLARDNGWTPTYTQRVIREYKRFAFLAVAAGHLVTPSDPVDQAWHLHLIYTKSYWKHFYGEVLGHRRSESWREFCRTMRSTEWQPRDAAGQFGGHRGDAIGGLIVGPLRTAP